MEDRMRPSFSSLLVALAFCAIYAPPARAQKPGSAKVQFVSAQQLLADARQAPEAAPHLTTKSYVNAADYGALTVRRTAPGAAELHTHMMDLWYVISGSGELETGGKLVGGHQTQPGEERGTGISGGQSRHIAKGDFVTIPAGIPHWLKAIDGKEFLYLVFKVKQ
jgi:quercetin dioxygenase-like cupin family protein